MFSFIVGPLSLMNATRDIDIILFRNLVNLREMPRQLAVTRITIQTKGQQKEKYINGSRLISATSLTGGFIIIELSLESSFELLEFLLDEISVTKFTD